MFTLYAAESYLLPLMQLINSLCTLSDKGNCFQVYFLSEILKTCGMYNKKPRGFDTTKMADGDPIKLDNIEIKVYVSLY